MKVCKSILALVGCLCAASGVTAQVNQGPNKNMAKVQQTPAAINDSVVYLPPGKTLGPVPRGDPEINCTLSLADNCQQFEFPRVAGTSFGSMGAGSSVSANVVADQFRTTAAGSVSQICWWGTYGTACGGEPDAANDHFFVRFLARGAQGQPDINNVVGSWEQGVSMTVTRRTICDVNSRSSVEYTATLTPAVTLANDTCYFIEIRNPVNAITNPQTTISWFWSHSAPPNDGTCFRDLTGDGYDPVQELTTGNVDRAYCIGINLAVPNNGGGPDGQGTQVCLGPPPPPICSNDPANGQAYDPSVAFGGFSASPSPAAVGLQLAEAYQSSVAGDLNSVCFRGFWVAQDGTQPAGPSAPTFDLTFYDNNNGQPGNVLQTYQVNGSTVRVFKLAFEYRIEFPNFHVNAGQCVFFSISIRTEFADPNFNLRFAWWLTTAGTVGDDHMNSRAAAGAADPGTWANQAFQDANGRQIGNAYYLFNVGPAQMANCPITAGACCVGLTCTPNSNAAACAAAGGVFQGLGSTCGTGTCVPPAPNDVCATATAISGTGIFAYDNRSDQGVTDQPPSCDPTSTHDVWFRWTAACNGDYTFSGCAAGGSATTDTVYAGFTSCGGTEIGCDDDGCGGVGVPSNLVISGITAGQTVLLRIAEFGTGAGETASFSVTRSGGPCTLSCPCNFNNDSALNSQDFFDFLGCFFTNGCAQADYNHDNVVNSQDFFDFLACFFAPPAGCP